MTKVRITGWIKGLNKVQLNHILRRHVGCGLREAKQAVDDLLDGATLEYEFPDRESASAFRNSAGDVGAICSMVEDAAGARIG